ncbi:MAG: replication initiation factor domain-containing protein [Lactobacillus sp.]|jgi:DNA relaxase NicK|nr:replication initiation factor domain-containing protein [Lactobacillus sp.]MCH4068530.1 replication initiation factor domain-containing protein [Lactobacillus sp.]MCI1304175.1 replication initiation factor domain-containing protein [Lactobacillus sp.]MCI1330332.1 replication initiation factor domain-containing protein [Lactobacillus sp.]MCI1358921.1 replication initiation factor domain-containing protein [Lactobacillus sp.]
MPVERGSMKKINNISIDQISFNFPVNHGNGIETGKKVALKVIKFFSFEKILGAGQELEYGLNGYTKSLKYGTETENVLIMWSAEQPQMGVMVIFYGSGKKLYEELARNCGIHIDWQKIIQEVYLHFRGHISRIDIAADLINYGYSIHAIDGKLNQGIYEFVNGKTKRKIELDRITTFGDSGKVDTIYVGSRRSDSFLRLYNKRKEALNKHNSYYFQAQRVIDWIRIEAEFKHRTAQKIGEEITYLVAAPRFYPYLVSCITNHWILVTNDDEKKK